MLRGLAFTTRILLREWRQARLEPEVAWLDRFLDPDSVALHVGASDGRHAFRMARRARRGRVHCVEPSGYALAVLGRVAALLRLANIERHRLALAAAPGRAWLATPVKRNGRLGRAFAYLSPTPVTAAATAAAHGFAGFRNEAVEVETLDRLCRRLGLARLDLLRIDVEGAEAEVLGGGRETIGRHRPVLLIEVHPRFLAERFAGSAEALWDDLAGLDYRLYALGDDGLRQVDRFADAPWRDYFGVPAEKLEAFRPALRD